MRSGRVFRPVRRESRARGYGRLWRRPDARAQRVEVDRSGVPRLSGDTQTPPPCRCQEASSSILGPGSRARFWGWSGVSWASRARRTFERWRAGTRSGGHWQLPHGRARDTQRPPLWWCFPRFDSDPVFSRLWPAMRRRASATSSWRARSPTRPATCATRRSCRPSFATARQCPVDHRLHAALQALRAGVQSGADLPQDRAAGRPAAHQDPAFGRPSTTEASRHSRAIGSNHMRFAGGVDTLRVTTDAAITYLAHETSFGLVKPVTLILGPDEPFEAAVDTDLARVPGADQGLLAQLGALARHPAGVPDGGDPRGHHAEALQLRGHRRDHRRPHHLDPRGAGHAAQLGLPLLLAAGRVLRHQGAQSPRRDADHGRLHPLHHQYRCRCRQAPAARLRHRAARSARRDHCPDLAGFGGCGPVRIGNQAAEQLQHDAYGSVILAASQMFIDERLPRMGDADLFRRLEPLGKQAVRFAMEPDAGPWEYRGRQRVHTHSATMCWVACDRLARIATPSWASWTAPRIGARKPTSCASEILESLLERAARGDRRRAGRRGARCQRAAAAGARTSAGQRRAVHPHLPHDRQGS